MWGRLSSIGANLSEFTKEVIAADESDDEQFFDDVDENNIEQQHQPMIKSPSTPNLHQQRPSQHYKSKSFDASSFANQQPSSATDTFFAQDSLTTQPEATTITSTQQQPDVYQQEIVKYQQLCHQAQQQAQQASFECKQWKQKYEQLQLDTDERFNDISTKYASFLKESENKHAADHKEYEQKMSKLESLLREKDNIIKKLEKQIQISRTATTTQKSQKQGSFESTTSISTTDWSESIEQQLNSLKSSIVDILSSSDNETLDNETICVVISDQTQLINTIQEVFEQTTKNIKGDLNNHLQSIQSTQSQSNEDDLATERQEIAQLCTDFRIILASYTNSSRILSPSPDKIIDHEFIKNELFELMETSKNLSEDQQYKLLENDKSLRQLQRQSNDTARKFLFIYSTILQICQRQGIQLKNTPELPKDSSTFDSVRMTDLNHITESIENDMKVKSSYAETCSKVYNVVVSLVGEFKSNLTIPQGETISETLLNAANVLQHLTKELIQMNNQLMSKLSQLQSDNFKLIEENTDNDRVRQRQIDSYRSDLHKQIEEKDIAIDNLNRKLYEQQNYISQLQSNYYSVQRQYSELEANMNKSNEFFEYQISEQEAEKKKYADQMQNLYNEIENYREREKQAEIKRQQLLQEISLLNKKIGKHNEELKEKEESLSSLEIVLEQVQADSARDINKIKLKCSDLEEANRKAKQEAEEAKIKHDKYESMMAENEQIQLQMKRNTEETSFMKKQFDTMRSMLEDAISRVNDENLVDRRVVNRLLLTLFDPSIELIEPQSATPQLGVDTNAKREDKIIGLLCSTLRMNEEQRKTMLLTLKNVMRKNTTIEQNTQESSGGFRWFRRSGNTESYNSAAAEKQNTQSLSQLWVQFLLAEAEKMPTDHSSTNSQHM
jgi:predicted RNase H-like HicB family nuclease